jgi:hypothetical protein
MENQLLGVPGIPLKNGSCPAVTVLFLDYTGLVGDIEGR